MRFLGMYGYMKHLNRIRIVIKTRLFRYLITFFHCHKQTFIRYLEGAGTRAGAGLGSPEAERTRVACTGAVTAARGEAASWTRGVTRVLII